MANADWIFCNRRAGLVGLIVVAALVGCGGEEPEAKTARPVRAIKVGDLKAIQGRVFPGRAKAKDEVDLSFQVAGPLVALPVDVGTKVKKGDVIASIDPKDFQAALESNQGNLGRAQANLLAMERGARPEELEQLKAAVQQAEASYKQAKAEHDRNARLIKTDAASKSEFDVSLAREQRTAAEVKQAKEDLNIGISGARQEDLDAKKAEIRALEAAVTNAKNQLEYCLLTAPFDGEVAAQYVDNFQTVQAKQTVVRLVDVSKIEVTIQVPESLITLVPQVKQAVCRFDAIAGREFVAHVTKIGSEASQTTRTYPVTVEVVQPEDVQILPGMAATVRNQTDVSGGGASPSIIVPAGAVFSATADQQGYVWVVDEGSHTVKRRAVKTGELTPVGITVSEGLKVGEWVVTTGVNSLRENQEVTILQEGSR